MIDLISRAFSGPGYESIFTLLKYRADSLVLVEVSNFNKDELCSWS
jgi:hypothetical protein